MNTLKESYLTALHDCISSAPTANREELLKAYLAFRQAGGSELTLGWAHLKTIEKAMGFEESTLKKSET